MGILTMNYLDEPNVITTVLMEDRRCKDRNRCQEGRCNATDFEDGERNHELRNAGGLEAGKDKGMDFSLELPEGTTS